MSDLARALAVAFQRKGADRMPGAVLRRTLAFDLHWFAPQDAKRVVERALETGLIVAEGEDVRVAFDVAAVPAPLGFVPTLAVLEEDVGPLPPARTTPASAPSAPAPPGPASMPAPTPPVVPATAPAAGPPVDDAADEQADQLERLTREERARRGNLLTHDVARLIVLRRLGEDVAPLVPEAERAVRAAAARP